MSGFQYGLFGLLCGCLAAAWAAEPPGDALLVPPGKSLREIAQEHLGDAELWQEILDSNGLRSVVEVQPGMRLKLPARVVMETNRQLTALQEEIQQATRLSARVFAPLEIERAVALRDQALSKRQGRAWQEALALAQEGRGQVQRAIAICQRKADQRAEAVLTDAKGTVQARPPEQQVWRPVETKAALAEGERLRTLANSSAEVQFRDESRLRLDENSQVLIQKMRTNLLEQKEQASVSILQGDVYALLGGNPGRGAFDLQIPGVELKGDSNNFYVNKGEQGARFANYEGELEVASAQGAVALRRNEGVSLKGNGFSSVKKLLPAPRPLTPADRDLSYRREVKLVWEPVEGAGSYWVEVSNDRTFAGQIPIVERVKASELTLPALQEGSWYWRLSAVDREEFPGPRSEPREFILARDLIPPYLQLREPAEGALLHSPRALLRGVVELGAQLSLNGEPLTPEANGEFQGEVTLAEGVNRIKVLAQDQAGNPSELIRTLNYRPPEPVTVELEGLAQPASAESEGPLRFYSRGPLFTLRGRTLPLTRLEVMDGDEQRLVAGEAAADGAFALLWPLQVETAEFRLHLLSPAGKARDLRLWVRFDQKPPVCRFDPLPASTREAQIALGGRCEDALTLTLDGAPVVLEGEQFHLVRPLREGENRFLWEARDAAGNLLRAEQRLLRDHSPPQINKTSLTPKREGERTWVELRVEVSDQSPLGANAPFLLQAGDFQYRGLLSLVPGGYLGQVALPLGNKEKPRLTELRVRDQLGNETEYLAK